MQAAGAFFPFFFLRLFVWEGFSEGLGRGSNGKLKDEASCR